MPELTLASCRKVQLMKKEVGLWIDHKQAVIVTLVDQVEETKRIISDIEKHVRYSGASHGSHDETTEIRRDRQDRRFDDYLSKYYGEVIACLRDADSILIFGPGEAKDELQKHLEGQALSERIVVMETTDRMTEGQIVAKVRQHFRG
jgi:stalled ribosome rescue protein Dom34